MPPKYSLPIRRFYLLLAVVIFANSCDKKQNISGTNRAAEAQTISRIIAFDTISSGKRKQELWKNFAAELKLDGENNPYRHYAKAMVYEDEDKGDSVSLEFKKMDSAYSSEAGFLRKLSLLDKGIDSNPQNAKTVNKVQTALADAENRKSRFLYRYYDLLARINYQNRNLQKSDYYTRLYFEANPNKNHPRIRQRFFDISFLLSAQLKDMKKMVEANENARKLALLIKDSMALTRTYTNESQIYGMQGETEKSIEVGRKYLKMLSAESKEKPFAYHNLAISFLKNSKPDSAIFYLNKEKELYQKRNTKARQFDFYNGLREAYEMRGDYRSALVAADSAAVIQLRNNSAIDEAKIAEVHEKYQVEKKDLNIRELKRRNERQLWFWIASIIILGTTLLAVYNSYRQRLLKNRNALLKEENKRLQTEQKMLQTQLNPHFIFNSIANLQSLIGSGERDLSMQYLASFSKLLRNTLEQNRQDFISIQ